MSFTLIRHGDSVKHYHIKQDENNFYKISARHSFPTIPELIDYHKLNSGGNDALIVKIVFKKFFK